MSLATRSQTTTREVKNTLAEATSVWAGRLEAAGVKVLRYGLVFVLSWIGGMKFTAYEAEGISVFASNSPLMS